MENFDVQQLLVFFAIDRLFNFFCNNENRCPRNLNRIEVYTCWNFFAIRVKNQRGTGSLVSRYWNTWEFGSFCKSLNNDCLEVLIAAQLKFYSLHRKENRHAFHISNQGEREKKVKLKFDVLATTMGLATVLLNLWIISYTSMANKNDWPVAFSKRGFRNCLGPWRWMGYP